MNLNGGDEITGIVTGTTWSSTLAANRSVYSKTSPAPQAGKKYTLMITGAPDAQTEPGGCGFGTASVDALGKISFAGILGDGSKVTQKAVVSKNGEWPMYLPLYKGAGSVLGWVTFVDKPDSDLNGMVSWIRTAQPKVKLYPLGFDLSDGLEVTGSQYTVINGTKVLNITDGMLTMQVIPLSWGVANSLTLSAKNLVTGTNRLSLKLTTKTGLFAGSAIDPHTSKSVSFRGALLQKVNAGYGNYLTADRSGSVQLNPLGESAPYGGLRQTIPGTIHLERFNVGGDGIGYSYPRHTNDWGFQRQEKIVFGYNTITGEGLLGWTLAGEWLKYSVNVLETGAYVFKVSCANTAPGAIIHMEIDGVNVTGPMNIPNTGAWDVFQTIQKSGVQLTSGHHVLRLVMDTNASNGGIGNIRNITITRAP